jgi:repressor of nif and glnA expression
MNLLRFVADKGRYVKLQRPTDFLILEVLAETGRNVAPNIALEIDKSRSHVNVRLPILADYGLVRKVGPAENSGLYEITERGEATLALREQYDSSDEFERLVEEYVSGEIDDVVALYNTPEATVEHFESDDPE